MPDVSALEAELAALRAQVAQLLPAPPYVSAPAPPAPRPVRLYTLVGNPETGYLHRDVRQVRRYVEAVALAKNAVSPGQTIPPDWVVPLRRVAAARARGLTWRQALGEAGLELNEDLEPQARAVRNELSSLWDGLLPLVGLTLNGVNDPTKDSLKAFLRRALT